MNKEKKLQQARELASSLLDLRLVDLEFMSEEEQKKWLTQYPGLTGNDFKNIRQEIIDTKIVQQSKIGWQVIPRDIAVIALCVIGIAFNLSAGVIVGVAALVLLSALFQTVFSEKVYKILAFAGWFTYPMLALLGYSLWRDGYTWWTAAGIAVLVWVLSYALDFLMQFIFQKFRIIKKSAPRGQ